MFLRTSSFFIISLLFSLSLFVNASEQTQQRKLFKKAEQRVWQAESTEYKNLYQQLHFYPLQPYLDQRRLMHKMKLSDGKEIAEFLTEYKGSPLDWPLRKKWLNYLAKRNQQSLFLEFFTSNNDAQLNCQYLTFKLNKGHKQKEVLPLVTKLWLKGKSQPKVCDPLFKQWKEAGYLTKANVWQRLSLAADGGKHTLIPYLTRLLPISEQYLGKLFHKVRKNPSYIQNLKRFPGKNIKENEIFTYGIKRLIWRNPEQALKTYKSAQKQLNLSFEQQQSIAQKFALALASKDHQKASYWLANVDDKKLTSNIVQWRIANVLRSENWQDIKKTLADLPENKKQNHQWRYWYARSLVETGNQKEGLALLTELANNRHYYGFLAASYIEQPYALQNNPINISEQEKIAILKYPEAKRAFELFHINRFHQARLEWNFWMKKLDKREQIVAAKLANELGWFDRAIFTLSSAGYLNDVDLRFPLAFDEEIKKHANKHKINPAWAFAITRRESSFMSDAHSAAGAKGLMQVMPGTAKQMARKKISTKYLLNARNNVNLGTKYLRKLLDRHKGNQILATAAYNAGPHRVKQWLKSDINLPADIWIETIPYKETREYVKSVLAYQQIYQHKVGQKESLFDQLLAMNITKL